MFTPGVSVGTMIIENDWYGLSSVSPVFTITSRKSAIDAFDENHLWPLMTHSSPSRTAVVVSSVGSAPAPGSVIEKHERYLPSRSGCIQRSFCSSVPPTAISSALPESGALLPKMLGPYGRLAEDLVHQAELHLAEAEAAHVRRQVGGPQALALDLLLQRVGDLLRTPRVPPACATTSPSVSSGKISSRTKRSIQSSFSWNSGSVLKSHAMRPDCKSGVRATSYRARESLAWGRPWRCPSPLSRRRRRATATRTGRPAAAARAAAGRRAPTASCRPSVGSHCLECAKADRPDVATRARYWNARQPTLVTYALIAINVAVFARGSASRTRSALAAAHARRRRASSTSASPRAPARATASATGSSRPASSTSGSSTSRSTCCCCSSSASCWSRRSGGSASRLLYFAALLAGSAGALLLRPDVAHGGASGAVFGLMGAAFVGMRNRGVNPFSTGLGTVADLNLVHHVHHPRHLDRRPPRRHRRRGHRRLGDPGARTTCGVPKWASYAAPVGGDGRVGAVSRSSPCTT